MPRKPNPELIDQISPEATDEWFDRARPAKEVLPGLLGEAIAQEMLKPKRGRPPSTTLLGSGWVRMLREQAVQRSG